ncbi:MAG: hypothetical protein ACOCV1_03970 [Bacillota bacterium]
MKNEVIKIGNVTFLTQSDKNIIKRVLNSDFDINDDFTGNRSKLFFDSNAQTSIVEEGIKAVSNQEEIQNDPVKIYLAKYQKNSCDWNDVIFYGILEEYEDIQMDQWSFLYSNKNYSVFRIFSYNLPVTLPLNGELPSYEHAPFIRYESFKNIWLRKKCIFQYEEPLVSLVENPGDDIWVLESSGNEQCIFTYTKSTPFGCDLTVPNLDNIKITEECECIESESSSSSSSSDSTLKESSESSESSITDLSSESSSLNSSSSEIRLFPKNIETLYIRLMGEPFTASEYILELEDPNADVLTWTATSHSSATLTTGTISLYMNKSGRFSFSMDVYVDGDKITVSNALLSNIRNDNFAYYSSSYLKGLAPICSDYITTKYKKSDGSVVLSYDLVISHETLKRNDGSAKKLNEIIYNYEMAELSIDDEAEKINFYFGKANTEHDNSDNICRAWGLFCLNYVSDGVWRYQNDQQEIQLSKSTGGCWDLYRKYIKSPTEIEEIEMQIDHETITTNDLVEYDGFTGIGIIPFYSIRGGVEVSGPEDICNDSNTVYAFYSADDCSQDSTYYPYADNLALTVSGSWIGRNSYLLSPTIIGGNLSVWNWCNEAEVNNFEYATLFSNDGIMWKLILSKQDENSKNYLFAEFIKENKQSNSFETIFKRINKSNLNLDGEWGSGDSEILISKV